MADGEHRPKSASEGDAPAGRVPLWERGDAVSGLSARARSLWAKSGDETGWLTLPQHLVDAACVAEALWCGWVPDAVKREIVRMTGLTEGQALILVTWLAGTHDIGKATQNFTRQIEATGTGADIVAGVGAAGLSLGAWRRAADMPFLPHGTASQVILAAWLKGRGVGGRVAGAFASVAGAHHGIAPAGQDVKQARILITEHPAEWHEVQEEILAAIAELTGIDEVLPDLRIRPAAPALSLLTGIVVMADWIASNKFAFPMVSRGTQADRVAAGTAAVDLSGAWHSVWPGHLDADEYFRSIFAWPGHFTARPVQRAVLEAVEGMPDGDGGLVIIEAPTGEGKTEAGLAAAHHLAVKDGAHGVFFAAPTMSTANGLFDRVLEWSRAATPGSEVASMFLAHSKSALSDSYQRLLLDGIDEDAAAAESEVGEVFASRWLSGRHKGLLSNFVVGTVDQVLMLALQMRYSMLRHVGLAGKVVLIDEVHAYDAYMYSYLAKTLEWLARYRVPVILMSATLPPAQKAQLIAAYRGEWSAEPVAVSSRAYPLVTTVAREQVREIEVPARPTDMHAVVEFIDDAVPAAVAQLGERLAEGGCALVVCNTVARAQEMYSACVEAFPGEVELHHSRFLANERAVKEDRLRAELGPDAHRGAGRPYRKVVVATQVAEQSLDIDVDLLISDVAPMDLLIQRAGRMHRHNRPAGDRPGPVIQPVMLVRGVLGRDPAPRLDPGTAAIYDPAVLLATVAELEETVIPDGFRRPDDIEPLVHAVYDPSREAPSGWEDAWAEARERSSEARAEALWRAQVFQIPGPGHAMKLEPLFARYHAPDRKVDPEQAAVAQVRDAGDSIEVIPIVVGEYGYHPWGSPAEASFGVEPEREVMDLLTRTTVRLPGTFTREGVIVKVLDDLEAHTPAEWANRHPLKGQLALVLDEGGRGEIAGRPVRYSSELGFEDLSAPSRGDRSVKSE